MAQITTLIPTFNRAPLLIRAIQSAQKQTYSDIQIAVFDNGSTDETKMRIEEAQRCDSRIIYHKHSQTIEAVENFQFALDSVKTPYFSILADDDLLLPQFYETALSQIKAPVFIGSTLEMSASGRLIAANADQWPDLTYFEPEQALSCLIQKYVNWTGTLFSKEIAKTIRIDPRIRIFDMDFMLRCGARYPISFSKTPCALFIQSSQSYSTKHKWKLFWPSWKLMEENLLEQSNHPEIGRLFRLVLSRKIDFYLSLHQLEKTVPIEREVIEYMCEGKKCPRWFTFYFRLCLASRLFLFPLLIVRVLWRFWRGSFGLGGRRLAR